MMPFIPNTPEALLPRSDSKHFASTCRGITASGRPCRRSIARSAMSSLKRASSTSSVAPPALSLYCWQHADQAVGTAMSPEGNSANTKQATGPCLEELPRCSLDTIIDRMGIMNLDATTTAKHERVVEKERRALLNAQHRRRRYEALDRDTPSYKQRESSKPGVAKPSFLAALCCFGVGDREGDREGDRLEIVRHAARQPRRAVDRAETKMAKTDAVRLSTAPAAAEEKCTKPETSELSTTSAEMSSRRMTALLRAEMSKPISTSDEAGFIYIFRLTDSQQAETTRQNATVLLKVGRASNVHRRMNEWARQCGYTPMLVRFYPYVSTSSIASSGLSEVVRRVRHSHRVERLIHIELAEKRVRAVECERCGKGHREWFEVTASRQGLKEVDGIVRKWIAWADGLDEDDNRIHVSNNDTLG